MWKLSLSIVTTALAMSGCLDPGCMRNSECSYGLECRANKCQKPLPAATPVAGTAAAQCYAYWCPYVQDGGQLHYGGSGGHPADTSTRYQDGGAPTSTGAGGMSSSATDAGTGTSGAGGSM